MPRFSVIIPCYNAAVTLRATLESLSAQTFQDWEAICIDDGSTDETRALVVAAAARDPRISLAAHPGKGPSDARNCGAIELANGEIVAFCDADDIWVKTKLDRLDKVMTDPAVDGAYARIAFFQDKTDRMHVTSKIAEGPLSIQQLLGENPVCTMSNVALRRSRFVEVGGFDPRLVHNEDLEWLIRQHRRNERGSGLVPDEPNGPVVRPDSYAGRSRNGSGHGPPLWRRAGRQGRGGASALSGPSRLAA